MGGTTPIYALPYPTDTDLVTNGDEAIQSLAERVETVLVATVPNADLSIAASGVAPGAVAGLSVSGMAQAGSNFTLTGGFFVQVATAGLYLVTAQLALGVATTGRAYIDVVPTTGPTIYGEVGAGTGALHLTTMVKLAANGTVKFECYATAGGAYNPAGIAKITRITGTAA